MNQHPNRTLQQTLLGFIGLLLLLLLSISFVLNISMARNNLELQLRSHAQDAANSLGLSLSASSSNLEKVSAERMVDSLFDSGEYQQIVLFKVDGEALVIRKRVDQVKDVPDWFVRLIDLKSPKKTADVMSGWSQFGTLVVESYTGFAEAELWSLLRAQLVWFAVMAILGLFGIHILLQRLLQPLKEIEHQARAMIAKDFSNRAPLASTRELAGVARAMNDMANQLGLVFSEQLHLIESLRAKSFLDELTGLGNREGFDARLKTELDSLKHTGQGSLILVQLNHLSLINDLKGRAEGDQFLCSIADLLKALLGLHAGAFAARRNAGTFSIFLPQAMSGEIDVIVDTLMNQLSSMTEIKQLLRDDCFHMGVACVQSGDTASILLSKVDMALRQAQGKKVSGWQRYAYIESIDANDEVRQANEWRSILQDVLAKRSLKLHTQKVFDKNNKLYYYQVLSRIQVNDSLIVASLFLPMAERFQLMVPIDQLVMEKVFAAFANGTLVIDDGVVEVDPPFYCVTLSESALLDARFMGWFDEQLSEYPHVARKLMIEVCEHVVNYNEHALVALSQLAKKHRFKISIERFGVTTASFSYLQRITIDVLKVDHSFIRAIHTNHANQFFLRSAIQLAHGQSIKMIAVGVEVEEEWQSLLSIGLDGAMGYYLERPMANAVFETE